MSVPLSDTRLTELRVRVPSAVCPAAHPDEADKGHVWVTGCLSGSDRCSACHLSQRALDSDEAVLLREVDRLRAELVAAQAAGYREAASDAALVVTHDADATAETLLTFLREGAEGREKFAANVAAAPTT